MSSQSRRKRQKRRRNVPQLQIFLRRPIHLQGDVSRFPGCHQLQSQVRRFNNNDDIFWYFFLRCTELSRDCFSLPRHRLRRGVCPGVRQDVYFPGFPTLKFLKYEVGHFLLLFHLLLYERVFRLVLSTLTYGFFKVPAKTSA